METKNINKPKAYEITKTTKWLFGLALLFLVCAFFAPITFTSFSLVDFTDKGEIGDTIGGTMGPFIAIAGVFLTFLAFYMQLEANKLQREQFEIQLNEDRIQYKKQLQSQQKQFSKTQFENQFYEMLRLHKENVNEVEIGISEFIEKEKYDYVVKGRKAFDLMVKEFEICYYAAKISFPKADLNKLVNESYAIFFHGLNNEIVKKDDYFKLLLEIDSHNYIKKYQYLNGIIKGKLKIDWEYKLNYRLFKGYSSLLAHYYRHLFQTVKFIVQQGDDFISYENKRKYLRILRAQLSNNEQAMLFYNWFSGFGIQWENAGNKFFTDFRMIHNLYQSLVLADIELESIFNIKDGYQVEKDRNFDPLFEFQDW